VAISTSADSIARRVMTLVGHPEVIDEPWFATGRQRAQHADLLDGFVGGWIGERTREEVLRAFAEAGAAVGPVYKPSELLEDPQVRALELVTTVDDPDLGEMRMQNLLWRMSRTPGRIRFTGRPLGADTDAVLGDELGLSAEELAELRDRGVAG
jgi:crotonobetainyl-CoA:carnitine CoA-transferase CaiB-like acyl-CoA transferase